MQGIDIHTVAQLLGHKDSRIAASTSILLPHFWPMAWRDWTLFSVFRVTKASPR